LGNVKKKKRKNIHKAFLMMSSASWTISEPDNRCNNLSVYLFLCQFSF